MSWHEETRAFKVAITLLFLGGMIAMWQVTKLLTRPQPPRALTPDEVHQVMQQHEAKEQIAWEQMKQQATTSTSE